MPVVGYDNAAFAGVLALGDVGIAVTMDDPAAAAAIGRDHSFERTFAARIDHLKAIAGR